MMRSHRRTAGALAIALAAAAAACGPSNRDRARSAADDALVTAEIRARATAIDPATVSLVRIATDHGKVTLDGSVASAAERASIEQAARDVRGVTAVADHIAIDPQAPTGAQIAADLELAARIHAALAAQTGVNAARIRVDVHRGVVTLSGSLPSAAHRDVADQTVRGTPGVVRLNDGITVEKR